MNDKLTTELLALNLKLLNASASGDWETYTQLCDPTITAFEAEARGHCIEGMPFHKFYFDLGGRKPPFNTTMADAKVRMLGDKAAVITCVRLTQYLNAAGSPETGSVEETRIWENQNGTWKHVHFHRSVL